MVAALIHILFPHAKEPKAAKKLRRPHSMLAKKYERFNHNELIRCSQQTLSMRLLIFFPRVYRKEPRCHSAFFLLVECLVFG